MQKKLDLSLYLILDPMLCGGIEGMVTTTHIAIEHGVTMVQLRSEKEYSRLHWYQAAIALKQALAATTVPLIINDMVDVALAVDADGVHVGQSDLPVAVVRRLLGQDKLVGLSVTHQTQLKAVPWSLVDYVGLGPVFATTTKQDAATSVGISMLTNWVSHCQKPAVAIGGINAHNIGQVMSSGVDGVAIISAICGQADIGLATTQLLHNAVSKP